MPPPVSDAAIAAVIRLARSGYLLFSAAGAADILSSRFPHTPNKHILAKCRASEPGMPSRRRPSRAGPQTSGPPQRQLTRLFVCPLVESILIFLSAAAVSGRPIAEKCPLIWAVSGAD